MNVIKLQKILTFSFVLFVILKYVFNQNIHEKYLFFIGSVLAVLANNTVSKKSKIELFDGSKLEFNKDAFKKLNTIVTGMTENGGLTIPGNLTVQGETFLGTEGSNDTNTTIYGQCKAERNLAVTQDIFTRKLEAKSDIIAKADITLDPGKYFHMNGCMQSKNQVTGTDSLYNHPDGKHYIRGGNLEVGEEIQLKGNMTMDKNKFLKMYGCIVMPNPVDPENVNKVSYLNHPVSSKNRGGYHYLKGNVFLEGGNTTIDKDLIVKGETEIHNVLKIKQPIYSSAPQSQAVYQKSIDSNNYTAHYYI